MRKNCHFKMGQKVVGFRDDGVSVLGEYVSYDKKAKRHVVRFSVPRSEFVKYEWCKEVKEVVNE